MDMLSSSYTLTCNCSAGLNRSILLQVTVRPVDQLTVDDSWSFLTNVKNRLTEYFIKVSLNDDSEVIGQNQSLLYCNHCVLEHFTKNFLIHESNLPSFSFVLLFMFFEQGSRD